MLIKELAVILPDERWAAATLGMTGLVDISGMFRKSLSVIPSCIARGSLRENLLSSLGISFAVT